MDESAARIFISKWCKKEGIKYPDFPFVALVQAAIAQDKEDWNRAVKDHFGIDVMQVPTDSLCDMLGRLAELVTGRTNCVWKYISWTDDKGNECHGLQFAKPEHTHGEWYGYAEAAVEQVLKEIKDAGC